ncbi:unnamed protein product, partial [Iphiclides podalirius]
MSEDHDKDCNASVDKSDDDQCHRTIADSEEVIEAQGQSTSDATSANASEEAQISATCSREISTCILNEKNESPEKETEKTRTLVWTRDGSKFAISWNLPDGTTTPEDYVALCYAGELV